ncbi:methyltransferase domain-containing protein [Paenibacillus sp. FSL K6-3182]|uniref:methyltransferase domain-containing protein n=1 Tax=unclassified Paenibacillus TaxID=185978 RepID=UPI0030D36CE0
MDSDETIQTIVNCMAVSGEDTSIQKIQTEHRLKLAQFWGITKGSRVLEIGCGQGDTTAVLAFLTGESGLVQGIDIASANYGSPITLGEAYEYLKKSELGNQLEMSFEVDILSDKINYPDQSFDFIVLSHCSWYLESFEHLTSIMEKVKKWGKQLCFAEWDLRVQYPEQTPHFLAALIQAQCECFKENSSSNIRTLFSQSDIRNIIENAGWEITDEISIYSSELQDGKWEINMTLEDYPHELKALTKIPSKLKTLINSEIGLLLEAVKQDHTKPMSTFALVAR